MYTIHIHGLHGVNIDLYVIVVSLFFLQTLFSVFRVNVAQSVCVIYEVGWVESPFISVSLIELSAMGKDVAYLTREQLRAEGGFYHMMGVYTIFLSTILAVESSRL